MLFRANAAARSWSITTPMKQTGHCQSATTAWAHRSRWRTPGRVLALALSKRWPINWKPPSKPKAGTLELRSQSRTARFELTDPRSRRDRTPRIGARAGRDGPRERQREHTWAPPASARSFVIKRFLNAQSEEHTSELQSLMRISYAVFCLKKKKKTKRNNKRKDIT